MKTYAYFSTAGVSKGPGRETCIIEQNGGFTGKYLDLVIYAHSCLKPRRLPALFVRLLLTNHSTARRVNMRSKLNLLYRSRVLKHSIRTLEVESSLVYCYTRERRRSSIRHGSYPELAGHHSRIGWALFRHPSSSPLRTGARSLLTRPSGWDMGSAEVLASG